MKLYRFFSPHENEPYPFSSANLTRNPGICFGPTSRAKCLIGLDTTTEGSFDLVVLLDAISPTGTIDGGERLGEGRRVSC